MENELLTAKEAVKKLKNDISETKKSVKESEVIVSRCIQELEQIALILRSRYEHVIIQKKEVNK